MERTTNRKRFVLGTSWLRALLVALLLALLFPAAVLALFSISNGMPASLVLGQDNFSSGSPNKGGSVSSSGFYIPYAVAVDPTSQKVFVSDFSNNRVLRFASVAALSNGAAAEGVLGQSNFTANTAATTQSGLSGPAGIYVDSSGRLWVADFNNGRVLRFDNAASKPNGANADGLLGQALFTASVLVTTQNGMRSPTDVFLDSTGRLWVSEQNSNRVLRFDNAASKPNGANADGVLGQNDFTSGLPNKGGTTSQSSMNYPIGVAGDSSGRLWVADNYNNRVLRFDNAASKANGANSDGLLGQALSTGNTPATTQNGLRNPFWVGLDATGRLFVSDYSNNRVLAFNNAASKANGANADNVLGQANFTTGTPNTGGIFAATLNGPGKPSYDSALDVLWVADTFNYRVLMYGTPTYKLFLPLATK